MKTILPPLTALLADAPAAPKTVRDLPERPLTRMAAVMCLLGSLVWDYAETVRDIAVQMRRPQTKPLSRAVRELHADYDRFRQYAVDSGTAARETELGLLFESLCREHLDRLCNGVGASKTLSGVAPEDVMLVKAVREAVAVLDALRLYAAECDRWIRDNGVYGHSILPDHFRRLAVLLPEFAGDCHGAGAETGSLTARILLNEIKNIDFLDENGKV